MEAAGRIRAAFAGFADDAENVEPAAIPTNMDAAANASYARE
jgi:hypothetical protein